MTVAPAAPAASSAFITTDAAHVRQHAVEVVLALGQERVQEAGRADVERAPLGASLRAGRGARRTRARAPTARGRAVSDQLLADRAGRRSAARAPTSAPSAAKAIVRHPPRARPGDRLAQPVLVRARRTPSRCRPARASSRAGRRASPARAGRPMRRQRALADDHRVHELDRHVVRRRSARRRSRPIAISRPPRANRSAIAWHSVAIRSASTGKHALGRRRRARRPRPSRCARSASAPTRAVVDTSTSAPPPATECSSRSQCRTASTPSPVRPLTTIVGHVGMHLVDPVQQQVEVDVEVRQQVDLVHDHEVAGAEHERVLERLVLALRDRRDHHARVLADAELGRADEVADVLDHEQVDLVERHARRAPSAPCWRPGGTRRRSRPRC